MSVEVFHPLYEAFRGEWTMMRDLHAGERVVKEKGALYLPPTPSMILDGCDKGEHTVGAKVYDGYKKRAPFPDYVKEGVETLVGMLHFKPATIELPASMEPMLTKATLTGESLFDLLRRINTEQLLTGRVGLLADLPKATTPGPAAPPTMAAAGTDTQDADPATAPPSSLTDPNFGLVPAPDVALPFISSYAAESVINWDDADEQEGFRALNLVVLNESGFIRTSDFTWRMFKKYRVLQLGDIGKEDSNEAAVYKMGVFNDTSSSTLAYSPESMMTPMWRGATLEQIPFVIINTKDLIAIPEQPPLLGLGQLVLTIYRSEADYRQNLFMQGQDTLVVVGGTRAPEGTPGTDDDALRTGAGSRIDVDMGGDAKYVGVNSQGLAEQRQALAADHQRASARSGHLMQTGKANSQESGEALKTRLAAQTASLTQIAVTGAKGLETLLKIVAEWVGANPDEVKVTPNMEFGDLQITSQDLGFLMTAKLQGFPLSRESLHMVAVEKRLTTFTYDEEMEKINAENMDLPPPPGSAGAPHVLPLDPNLPPNPDDPNAAKPGNTPPGNKPPAKPPAKAPAKK